MAAATSEDPGFVSITSLSGEQELQALQSRVFDPGVSTQQQDAILAELGALFLDDLGIGNPRSNVRRS